VNLSDTIKREIETGQNVQPDPPRPPNRNFQRPQFLAFLRSSLFPLLSLTLGMVVLFGLVWQVPFSYKIDPNKDTHLDEPFLQNFHAIEPGNGLSEANPFYYRWSKGEGRLYFPGIGKNRYTFKITLTTINPDPKFRVFANETQIGGIYTAEEGTKTYEFEIPAEAIQGRSGDLTVYVRFTQFTPKGDPRTLGFALLSAEISGGSAFPLIPSVSQIAYLLTAILLVFSIVLISGGTATAAALTGGAFGLILAWVIISARVWLTVFSERLIYALFLSLICVALVVSVRKLIARVQSPPTQPNPLAGEGVTHPVTGADFIPHPFPPTLTLPRKGGGDYWSWALSIFGLALAVRFGGLIYPGVYNVDIGFHVNNYEIFWDKWNFFRKISSQEWGGRDTFYPPTAYLFGGLLRWLFEDTITLLRFWMGLLDSARILLIFFLVKRVTGDGRAAIISALLMATMPISLISVSFGQVAQLAGEFVALLLLVMVVVYYEKLRQWQYFVPVLLLFLIAFVQHPGVILLTGTTFFALAIILFFRKREGGKILLLIFGVALLISIGLYHRVTLAEMVPQAWQTLESKISGKPLPTEPNKRGKYQYGGSVNDERLDLRKRYTDDFGVYMSGGFAGFWKEAQVYYQVIPLLFLPYALWWLRRRTRDERRRTNNKVKKQTSNETKVLPVTHHPTPITLLRWRLAWAGFVWVGVAILFALVGLFLNLYVRYSLFLLPIVAISTGIGLAHLWKRAGLWGKIVAVGICAFIVLSGLLVYYDRIVYYIDYR
jgi:hypothetical protein